MYSVIVLLETQYDDFPQCLINLDRVFSKMEKSYELIVLANGTGNFFRSVQDRFTMLENRMRAFEFGTQVAPAVCLKAVANEARGDILAIFGSYQQLTDDSIEKCIKAMEDPEIDIISPWRQNRVDPAFNQMQSRVFNWLARRFGGTDLHDFSCTVKVCKRKVLEEINLYGNMFRFFPVLAAARGFTIHELRV
ncbi:MAG: glycosyltransferase, partial [Desulfobacterales bacterium]|nr:glycosyltransferase [Desulfobacterales bacterium]